MKSHNEPLVSVFIPTKNRLELLARAINSVKAQTYKNIEIIVVDDGSTDETWSYLQQQNQTSGTVIIRNEESQGACAARNAAILASTGNFVTGLDDDDYFAPDRIDQFVKRWETSESVAGLFDSVQIITANGRVIRHQKQVVTYQNLRKTNLVGSLVFAPRSHYIEAGLFDKAMPAWQDWDLWIRMARIFGDFVNIGRTSCVLDEIHGNARITTGNEKKIRLAKENLTKKLQPLTRFEKSSLIISMHGYPQVKPKVREIFTLIATGRVRSTMRSVKKWLNLRK
ncbi:Glycosyl transferase family 2 [Candidatus Methylobacter favarea]|uniref:Glycosyl transferase family 2 n=1 Tax=Candidatus Methylobacter favarea TaxID=2707345 RepID=A0A8S0W8Y5_9GAMM|nr:glycosyltransferase [Candidatus Methylobacter favarea]CAA9889564.1 Glycosyl transferase family 2 [Candidatus Methylobacter favarea]